MTAHRPRQTGPLEEASLIEVLFSGAPTPRTGWFGSVWYPPTDVYETEDEIVVQVEVAGVQQSDFSITLHDRRLLISGARTDRSPLRRAYYQLEVHFGEFRSEVDLPHAVDETRIDAEYSHGFLRVVLPKLQPHLIPVKE